MIRGHNRFRGIPDSFPRIVCLCGSTRFYRAFQEANYSETMAGNIVLSVGFYPHSSAATGHGEGVGHDSAEKLKLDELHFRKIDLADEILVLNLPRYYCGYTKRWLDAPGQCPACIGTNRELHDLVAINYIGQSTANEIAYAESRGKTIRYLLQPMEMPT